MSQIPKHLQDPAFRFCLIKPGEKAPFEPAWQKNGLLCNDPKIQKHLKAGGNIGVITGYGELGVVDADHNETATVVRNNLPKTFAVKTGSGGMHFYFIIASRKETAAYRVLKNGELALGEIRLKSSQCVIPPSIHPSGNPYEVAEDIPIATVEEATLMEVFESYLAKKTPEILNVPDNEECSDEIVTKIMGLKMPSDLMDGKLEGYEFPSRSEAELALITLFVRYGLGKNQIKSLMNKCGIGKWQEATNSYRELTLKKGFSFVATKSATLEEVLGVYDKWFHMTERAKHAVELTLAIAKASRERGEPLWLFIIAPSGALKTESLRPLIGLPGVYRIHKFSRNTLISGHPKMKDLAPVLNDKLVIVPDLAQILSMHHNDKAEVFSQMRDLYDGYAGKHTGMGSWKSYKDIYCCMLAASTPNIDSQILIHQALGTREFYFRMGAVKNKTALTNNVWANMGSETTMREELKQVTEGFLFRRDLPSKEVSENSKKKIIDYCTAGALLRASGEIDSFTGEIRNKVYPEEPTRYLKQMKRLYTYLMSLSPDYPEERALQIIREVVLSCMDQNRLTVLSDLIKNPYDRSAYTIRNETMLGKKTIVSQLQIMWNQGIVGKTAGSVNEETGMWRGEKWYLSDNQDVTKIKDLLEGYDDE